jgi:hypothetical protein
VSDAPIHVSPPHLDGVICTSAKHTPLVGVRYQCIHTACVSHKCLHTLQCSQMPYADGVVVGSTEETFAVDAETVHRTLVT